MMDKVALLKGKASELRRLLEAHEKTNADARSLLETLTPLLDEVSNGRVVQPTHYEFRRALGREHPFYDPSSLFSCAHAEFAAALEDWASQPWYREVLKRSGK